MDSAGKFALTTSEDRTARVWDLATGALAKTLRIQPASGPDATILTGALSPDGRTVVLSARSDNASLYVIDRATGKLLHRLPNLPGSALSLAWSEDGKLLAATFQHGVLVLDAKKWETLWDDGSYGAESLSVNFGVGNRLVTTSFDGQVREYDAGGKAIASAGPYVRARNARFSPDGERIAVSAEDAAHVIVLAAKDLTELFEPQVEGITGDLRSIAWSRDGSLLYAAGSSHVMRVWSGGGSGVANDTPSPASDTISDLVSLPKGIAFASADGSWGVIDAKGSQAHPPLTADFRGLRMRLSPDGKAVRFAYKSGGHDLAAFRADTLKLTAGMEKEVDWAAPNVPLELPTLDPREAIRAAATSPDGSFIAIGSDIALHVVAKDAAETWRTTVPASVRAVNISTDGKLVVAAYGDGTIRWHRATDGATLLVFFPHADRKRWVAYTPSGYFATAPTAKALATCTEGITPDGPGASTARACSDRPDVVKRVLDTLDEAEAIKPVAAPRPAKAAGRSSPPR